MTGVGLRDGVIATAGPGGSATMCCGAGMVPTGDALGEGEDVAVGGDDAAVAVGRAFCVRVNDGLADGEAITVAVVAAEDETLAGVALGAGAGVVSAATIAGFTKVFDGASDGGVASDFILVRAFSTAGRSEISSQP